MRRLCGAIAVVAAASLLPSFAWARPKDLVKRINSAERFLEELMDAPDTAIPSALLRECKGVIIMRQYRVGFGIGVRGGYCVAMVRDEKTGAWSPPAFMTAGEGSIGIQAGGQSVDSVILVMNAEGMRMLLKSKFKVWVDASAAIGPVGRDAAAKVSPGTAFLVYSRAKGLYAGASFEGGFLVADDAAAARFYGAEGIKTKEVLFQDRVEMPQEARHLAAALDRHAGKETAAGQ